MVDLGPGWGLGWTGVDCGVSEPDAGAGVMLELELELDQSWPQRRSTRSDNHKSGASALASGSDSQQLRNKISELRAGALVMQVSDKRSVRPQNFCARPLHNMTIATDIFMPVDLRRGTLM